MRVIFSCLCAQTHSIKILILSYAFTITAKLGTDMFLTTEPVLPTP